MDPFSVARDVAVIGGVPTPGLAQVRGGAKLLQWDKRKGYGNSGATTVFTGDGLTTFQLTLSFYDGVGGLTIEQQIDRYTSEILPVLAKSFTGKSAVDFYHPDISEPPIDVRAVVPEEIGQLTQDDSGIDSVTIKFLQFRKPKPAVGKPAGSSAGKKPGSTPKPEDELDRAIRAATGELKDKAKKLFS